MKDYKKLLALELNKDNPDWRAIEHFSRQAVDADPNNVRFSVDAGHIQRLGFELVSKQDTALAELIKNSFDADATKVTVEFFNYDKIGGSVIIKDDGVGMSADVVRDAWMRISTANKHDRPVSPRYGRLRAGRKGIGRFSVQRLGKGLLLETEVKNSPNGVRVKFNWDNDFLSGKLLNDVFSHIEYYPKPLEREGTSLKILDLRESWSEAMIQRAWRVVLLLQPPFPVSRRQEYIYNDAYELDPGFEVVINGITGHEQRTKLSIESSFLDHALAEITGEISDNGHAFVHVHSTKLGIDDTQEFSTPFLLTGRIFFSSKYFIYDRDILSGLVISLAAEMGRNYGGIRIYRNGFRVPPYGEQSDDWLALDQDVGRRKILFPVAV